MSGVQDSHPAFAARLRECIDAVGGVTKLSQMVGLHRNTIRLYLEKAEPPRQMVIKLAEAAQRSPEWLLTGFDPKSARASALTAGGNDTKWLSEENLPAYKERLARSVERAGGAAVVQKATGIDDRRWSEIVAGQPVTASELLAISQALAVSIDWLLGSHHQNLSSFVAIDELVAKFDGESLSVRIQRATTVAFDRHWIERTLHCPPGDLLHVTAPNSDMEPLIRAGASLLVQRTASITTDGIYVFKMADQFQVRRLQFVGSDTARVTALSDSYVPWSIKNPRMNSEVNFYGKVLWWSRLP